MTDDIATPPLRDLPPGHLEARKQHLLSEIARASERPRRSFPTVPLFERRRPWRPAAVVAFAVAVTVVLLGVFGGGGSPGGPSSAAAGVFHRLAGRIAAQPLTPQPGQYLYLDFKSEWGAFQGNSTCETRSVEHRQIWIGVDGSGLDRSARGPGHFTSAADRATCLSLATTAQEKANLQYMLAARTSDDWNAPRCMELGPTRDWSSLSSDPQVLLQQIVNLYGGGKPTPANQFSYIAEVLGQTDAPPDVRANIYRAAALIPGVRSLGTVLDHDGRPGIGLAITTGEGTSNATDELIFDPQTGELLGETATGRYGGWNVYLDNKVVNGLPTQPPAPLTPPCTSRGEGTVQDIPGGSITTGKGLSSQQ